MEIKVRQQGDHTLLSLYGRLDTNTSPKLENELTKVFDSKCKDLTLDFANLEYISSAGLRVLLAAQKKINDVVGKMTLTHVSEPVKEVFDMTGFSEFLNIE